VQLLPLNHPLRVAGEVATLDHLSHDGSTSAWAGAVGRGPTTRSVSPTRRARRRFSEALEIILTGVKGEPFSYEGKFYRFNNANREPAPVQQPHPPVRWPRRLRTPFSARRPDGPPIFVGFAGWPSPGWPDT